MNSGSLSQKLSEALTDSALLSLQDVWPWQLAALLVIGIVTALYAWRFGVRTAAKQPLTSAATLFDGLSRRLAVPAVAGVLSLIAYGLFLAIGLPSTILVAFLLLVVLLLVARVAIFALAHVLIKTPTLTVMERVAGWILWSVMVLFLLNRLTPIIDAVDAIAIPVGAKRVSLLDAARVVLVLLSFVIGASYLGAVIERRLLALTHLPVGMRVGTAKVTRVVLVVMAVLVALNSVGLDLTALTVLGGAVGVGLGFGLQRIASNFVSGFILLGDRSIRPGDVITIGTRFGVVRELRARYVVVRDRDGVDTLIPNENIITSEVVNWSYADRNIRLKLPVQISYQDDPREAMALMERAAQLHPRVEKQPAAAARIMGFADSGIDLELRFWIHDPEDGVNNVRSDLFLAIWDAFKAANITIPYPQRDVYVRSSINVPPGLTKGGELKRSD